MPSIPSDQPYLFYVHAPIRYVSTIEQLPADTKFFLVQGENETEAETTKHWSPAGPSWSYASLIIASTRRLFFLFHPRADPG